MSNNAYLLNTALLSSDPYLLWRKRREPGNDYAEVGEGVYRIPIPWLCCFRSADLRRVLLPETGDHDQASARAVRLPCTTVRQAQRNLEQALPLLARIAGDEALVRPYWQDALQRLERLPLPYLTIHSLELMSLAGVEEHAQLLVRALGGGDDAIAALKELSGYEDGSPPPSFAQFCGEAPDTPEVEPANGAALDSGMFGEDHYRWRRHDPDLRMERDDLAAEALAQQTAGAPGATTSSELIGGRDNRPFLAVGALLAALGAGLAYYSVYVPWAAARAAGRAASFDQKECGAAVLGLGLGLTYLLGRVRLEPWFGVPDKPRWPVFIYAGAWFGLGVALSRLL